MQTDPRIVNRRECRKCGKEIGFLESAASRSARIEDQNAAPKMMPVDVKPELRFNAAGEALWVYSSHFATCPKAAEVRRDMIERGKVLPAAEPEEGREPGSDDAPGEPLQPKPPCSKCGRRIALAKDLPVCPSCWNAMGPQEQVELGRAPLSVIVCTRGRKTK